MRREQEKARKEYKRKSNIILRLTETGRIYNLVRNNIENQNNNLNSMDQNGRNGSQGYNINGQGGL